MKKIYISPTAEILDVQMDHKFCLGSNNSTESAVAQDGNSNNKVPGTGGDKTPTPGGRGAKRFDLWDDEDNEADWDE